nr:hypothetical protein GCM10020093_090460 [Planobispora longispora]
MVTVRPARDLSVSRRARSAPSATGVSNRAESLAALPSTTSEVIEAVAVSGPRAPGRTTPVIVTPPVLPAGTSASEAQITSPRTRPGRHSATSALTISTPAGIRTVSTGSTASPGPALRTFTR